MNASLLPSLVDEISTKINELLKNTMKDMKEAEQRTRHSKHDAEKFLQRNCDKFRLWESRFKDYFQRATRCEQLVKLWEEGSSSEPSYIPRRFRKDKYHIKSSMELAVLKVRERNELISEIEMLKLRELENRRRIEDLAVDVFNFVTENNQDMEK